MLAELVMLDCRCNKANEEPAAGATPTCWKMLAASTAPSNPSPPTPLPTHPPPTHPPTCRKMLAA
jgi:hypothetical protein